MRNVFSVAGVLLLVGCATVSQMTATGGSRSDGIVRLSYEQGMFDKVAINETAGLNTARQRCSTWGYSDAEAFGGVTRQCQAMSGYGCTRWFVTKEYQCLSSTRAAPASPAAVIEPITEGVRKVRANTASGYCLDVPPDYVGTGASNRPAVTGALPRCSSLSPN